ncbi:MAG: DNA mismatch repair protein MutS [Haloarculaceae archaeon]
MASGIVGEYLSLQEGTEADLLAMQMGDFYEFFGDDARTVGEELDLKVSQRSSGGESYDMAGVPVDDLQPYLKALVERGYRVAVADQHEVEGGHERRVSRVVTPGTLVDPSAEDARYLAAAVLEGGAGADGDSVGLAFLDVTTGRFHVTTLSGADARTRARTELYRFDPTEVLPGPDLRNDDAFLSAIRERSDATFTLHDAEAFAPGRARHALREQFGGAADSLVGGAAVEATGEGAALRAAGAALAYVEETGVGVLASVTRLRAYEPDEHVSLDATTQRNLELVEPMTGGGRSLLSVVDHTITAAGGRLLKEWLTRPLRSRADLERRQEGVAALAEDAMARERLRELLADAYDLERLASRTVSGSAGPEALVRVRETFGLVPDLVETVASSRLAGTPVESVLEDLDREAAADLHAALDDALAEEPRTAGEGLVTPGFDDDLDELVAEHETALEWVETLPGREKRRTELSRVTVDRNRTDGYYIQVGKSESDRVPEEYEGIKTLKNSERYVTAELREKEREILRLEERRAEVERRVFEELRERVADRADLLQSVGRALAELDTLASMAVHAVRNDWVRPDLVGEDALHLEAARHPVVEQTEEFVPNDLHLDRDRRFLIVTGPNMSGKSTYMRQAALVVLLAQTGSFVPARSARVGLVDGVFTRVGALDELAGGRSTFMVEMQELSNILHSATEDSLVVLDEVGRGTATYDGISIAWAATEYLVNTVRSKTLFATHYHELTALADRLPGVHNVHMTADERDGDVTFLRTVAEGPADRSYGVHVADLAGVPEPVVERAGDVLRRLREDEAIDVRGSERTEGGDGDGTRQVVFDLGSGGYREARTADGGEPGGPGSPPDATGTDPDTVDPATEAVIEGLRGTDVNGTPPVELMAKVQEWQERLEEN